MPLKRIGWLFNTPYLSTGLWAWQATSPIEEDLDQLWEKIREAIEDGLPKTAIKHLAKLRLKPTRLKTAFLAELRDAGS